MSRWYLRGVNDPRVAAREASRNWLFDVRQVWFCVLKVLGV